MFYTDVIVNWKQSIILPIFVCVSVSIVSIILWINSSQAYSNQYIKRFNTDSRAKETVRYKYAEVFPLITSKRKIQLSPVGYNNLCINACHYNYEAADIGAPEGTQVVVATSGVVIGVNQDSVAQSKNAGASVRIRGADGLWYYYAHMRAGSVPVHVGQVVRAGSELGAVGSAEEAQGTKPHLHFDVSVVENGFDRGTSICSDLCSQLVAPQPLLRKAYQALPEGLL